MKLSRLGLFLVFFAFSVAIRAGELSVFPLFTDHGILQQDTVVAIWGAASPNSQIHVIFCGQDAAAIADAAGKWIVHLRTPKAEPGRMEGYDLVIRSADAQIVLHDVAVGEVWIGSGQSNIDTRLDMYCIGAGESALANYPGIRLYSAAWGRAGGRSVNGDFSQYKWLPCTPETALGFSAAGYFFSRELQKALNVPVGFINMAVGGSPLSSWVLPEWMSADPRMTANMEKFTTVTYPNFIEQRKASLAKWQAMCDEAKEKGEKPNPAWPPFQGPADQPLKNFIGGNYVTHTAVVMPFVFKGMLWDQGESGVGYTLKGDYDVIFDIMLQHLRKGFGYDLPVVYCEMPKGKGWGPTIHEDISKSSFSVPGDPIPLADLPADAPDAGPVFAGFAKENDPFLRMNALPFCSMAVTRDLQAALHPHSKDEYGARFCRTALHRVYGQDVECFEPVITSAKRSGDELILTFDHAGTGLVALGGRPLQGFYISDAKGKSVWAAGRIEADHVILSGAGIANAETVSYANVNHGRVMWANLFNKDGLPAYAMTVRIE